MNSLGGVLVPLAGEAQQASARARVAVFFAGFPQSFGSERTWGPTFVSALRNLGWSEGNNLAL